MRTVLLLALAACNQALGLEPTVSVVAVDTDSDGIPDERDNCPKRANADQLDEDGDAVGDACDNCPLIANVDQAAIGDGDGFGDVCDPHPTADGDCMIIEDTFADPNAFATHWQIVSNEVAPDVRAEPGDVAINPLIFAGGIAVVARDGVTNGTRYDIIAVGRLASLSPDSGVETGAVTNLARLGDGFRCELMNGSRGLTVAAQFPNFVSSPTRPLSTVPVRDKVVFRLASEDVAGRVFVHCRVDYGFATGTAGIDNTITSAGWPGVWTTDDPLVLEAIEISQFMPGQTCPDPIIR